MSRCGVCDSSTGRKPSVSCDGFCGKVFHAACINIPGELTPHIASIKGLSWKCDTCALLQDKMCNKEFKDLFEKKCDELFKNFAAKFESMKTDILQLVSTSVPDIASPSTASAPASSYAAKLRQGSQQKIVIKPKNTNQVNSLTKSDILHTVNPIDSNIKINNVKHIRNGGILLGCSNSTEASKLKKLAEEKLSSNYVIHELKSIQPHIRVVGITDKLDDVTLVQYMKKQNDIIFDTTSSCKVSRFWPTKHNKDVYQATLQVDASSYQKAIGQGHLLIGLDGCAVYDAISVPRCHNCNGYYHGKSSCKNKTTCPLCSKYHDVKNCPDASQLCCVNCLNVKVAQKSDINTNHAAWDYSNCSTYKKAVQKLKSDLFGEPA